MNQDGRALSERDLERIEENFLDGDYCDREIALVFQTIRVQRQVLRELFNCFNRELGNRYFVAEPIRSSTLAYMKERTNLEDPK